MKANTISLGVIEKGPSLDVNLPVLVDTRALITGNSGAGKSRLLRRLAEQAFGKVQIIVLDPEGEFVTLRERHAFLLAGRGGEVPAEPRAAALLARRLMELNVSAVLDLYDLKLHERRSFARLFLEALVDLPKDLYAPVLVMVDEAHLFCPEKSAGESESTSAVIELMTRGRKRGLCGILATQRLSKLHKDAAAEAKNVFIGGITLDVDQKRAADTLGIAGREGRLGLRQLEPGTFLAFGPALGHRDVLPFRVGETRTTHPKAGERHEQKPPPPPEAIQKVASELKDLPQQAADEIRTLQAAQARVRELERELKAARTATPAPAPPKRVEVPVLREPQLTRLERALGSLVDAIDHEAELKAKRTERIREVLVPIQEAVTSLRGHAGRTYETLLGPVHVAKPLKAMRFHADSRIHESLNRKGAQPAQPTGALGKGEARILTAIAQHSTQGGVTREQLSVLTGYKRSSRDAYLQRLSAAGLVGTVGDRINVTDSGMDALPSDFRPLPTGDELRRHWLERLPEGERRILALLIERYPEAVAREELGDPIGYKRSSRDAFIQRLAARRLVQTERGTVRASGVLFS